MKGLTKKQREILDFIEEYIGAHRYSPSFREIGDHFGFSSLGSVYNHIQLLKKKGALQFQDKTPRSLLPEKMESVRKKSVVPLIGILRIGMPPELFSSSEKIELASFLLPSEEEYYLLRIEGEAAAEDLMQSGDLLAIVPRPAQSGESVLALINHYTSFVKRIFFDSPYVRLESSNPHVQPMVLREDHVEIQGVVVGLLRSYNQSSWSESSKA